MKLLGSIFSAIIVLAMVVMPIASAENVIPVATPFITIDSIGNHTIGDVFFINGTTNLPGSENLTISLSYTFNMQHRLYPLSSNTSAEIPNVSISLSRSGTNRWSVNATDIVHELDNGEYFVYVHSFVDYSCHTPECSVPKASEASVFILYSIDNGTIQKIAPIQYAISSTTLSEGIPGSASPKQSPGYGPIITVIGLCAVGLMVHRH
jgi:hypothetical protein